MPSRRRGARRGQAFDAPLVALRCLLELALLGQPELVVFAASDVLTRFNSKRLFDHSRTCTRRGRRVQKVSGPWIFGRRRGDRDDGRAAAEGGEHGGTVGLDQGGIMIASFY